MALREAVEWGVDGVDGGADGATTSQPGVMRVPSREFAEYLAGRCIGVRVVRRTVTTWEYADEREGQ